MNDLNDAILDACLDELLGGQCPPDLTERILQALAMSAPNKVPGKESPTSVPPADLLARPPIENGEVLQSEGPRHLGCPMPASAGHRWRWSTWRLTAAAAACILLALGGAWFASTLFPDPSGRPVVVAEGNGKSSQGAAPAEARQAANPEAANPEGAANPDGLKTTAQAAGGHNESAQQPDGSLAHDAVPPGDAGLADTVGPADNSSSRSAEPQASQEKPQRDDLPPQTQIASDTPPASTLIPTPSAGSDEEVIAFINAMVHRGWEEAGIGPSPPATDEEWCRRVYLDVLGRIPSIDEVGQFLGNRRRDKRPRLVDRLLGLSDDDLGLDYTDAYARRWTTVWTNTLIGRSGGMQAGSPVNRDGLQHYLRQSFQQNKPYDQMVFELLSADGVNMPGQDDYNGAVNFLLGNVQDEAAAATAKTAQIFLGIQVQCTQCHNHPFNQWQQSQFWQLNAFFRQVRAKPETIARTNVMRLVDEDYSGSMGDTKEAEVFYELRNGQMAMALPTFVDGTAINPDGRVARVNRRDELARLVTRSELLPSALVNRLWGQFFGYGFTKPVDDVGPHNPPSHPELLERLGREFAAREYDLKNLIRWIALSEPYSLSSKFGKAYGNEQDDPSLGSPALFSHFYLRQMTAEELYESLLVASRAQQAEVSYEAQERTKSEWLQQFTMAFGTDENNEATTFDGTIAQTLMLMNGQLIQKATSSEAGTFLHDVLSQAGKRSTAIKQLYLAALARKPSPNELRVANELLLARQGDTATVLEDVWWALLNSNEFILNH